MAIGVPLGIFAARRPRLSAPLVGLANVVQTVPSLAMFGFLLPVPFLGGIGARAAIVVLMLYAPAADRADRRSRASPGSIDRSAKPASRMGMTPRQLLRQVELPLALPSIVAGIRVAAVVGVGSATIAAAIGAGGLGEYIYRGLSMVDTTVILAGAIPAAALALLVDRGLLWARAPAVVPASTRARAGRRSPSRAPSCRGARRRGGRWRSRATGAIVVGSKNFTEQLVLGEILAQTIERGHELPVDAASTWAAR